MKKLYLKKIISTLTAIILLVGTTVCSIPVHKTYAENVTADFEIDSELLRCIVDTNTFKYDSDNNQIITKEEFANSYGMQIDCEGYDIKDWSALKYGTGWKMIIIKNCKGADFSALSELTNLYEVCFTGCEDFSTITGLDKIPNLSKLTVSSKTIIDLNTFTSYTKLAELSVTAPEISGYESLVDMKELNSLALAGETCKGIENYPDVFIVNDLSLSFKDLTAAEMAEFVKKQPYIKYLSVKDSNIGGLSWINDLDRLYYLDIRNNWCRDISSLLGHKNLKSMDLYLSGNPWAPDSEDLLAKELLGIDDEYTVSTGEYIYLDEMFPDWYCDIIGDLEFSVSDESIASVRHSYSQVYFFSPGEVSLLVSNGKDVNLEYKITVQGEPVTTATPKPDDEPTPTPDDKPAPTHDSEPPIYAAITPGDINSDSDITARDALMVLKHAAKLENLDEYASLCADVNVDYTIDAGDALDILKYAAGLISSFEDIAVNTYPPVEPCPTESPEPDKAPSGYDNSFIININSAEKNEYTAADFSDIEATEVRTVGMTKTDTGYTYELIIGLNSETCTEETLDNAMATVLNYENVTSVSYNKYCPHESIIELNYDEYELKVGESISLYIDEYSPYNSSTHFYCILIKLNSNTISGSEISLDALAPFEVEELLTMEQLSKKYVTWTYDYSDKYNFNDDMTYALILNRSADYTTIANSLSQIPEIETVGVLFESYPTGARNYEYWDISDQSLATMVLSGGLANQNGSDLTKLDQTATITAVAPGEVIISVTKAGWGNVEGTGTCKITIVE